MKNIELVKTLLKDIQDTYTLVKRFENSSQIPGIELDLALSKVRELYDLLLKLEVEKPEIGNELPQKEKVAGEIRKKDKDEKSSDPDLEIEDKKTEEPTVEDSGYEEIIDEEIVEDDKSDGDSKSKPKSNGKTIVAEKFENKKSMHDTISGNRATVDRATKIQSKPIQDMHNAIGLNDKFLFIRELFGGNKDKYWEAIQLLNNFDTYDNALEFLKEENDWDFESETVQRLMEIVKRKFTEK